MKLTQEQIHGLATGQIKVITLHKKYGIPTRTAYRAVAQAVIDGQLPERLLGNAYVRRYHESLTTGRSMHSMIREGRSTSSVAPAPSPVLAAAGYDQDAPKKTPADAWAEHKTVFEQRIRKTRDHTITRQDDSPFVIYHATDVHLDDDATPLSVLEADIKASHEMGAIMVHGGDALNNWPAGGKLAKKWADQSCTLEDSLLRLKHYISILQPDVWVDGNHEEMSSHLTYLIDDNLPSGTIRDYWTADVTIRSPGGRDCKLAVSHKFQKGSSWFHQLHGHLREILEGEHRDVLLDGHLHSAGVMQHYMPERGQTTLCVASAGYKVVDRFASRISRGGKAPKLAGRAHWVVVDPRAPDDGTFCVAFTDPGQAGTYLDSLTKIRKAA